MRMITRDVDYGIRALVYMARNPDKMVSVQEVVDALKMPKAFMRRVFQELSRHNILKSIKGKGGGFVLNVSAQKIFVTDLMKIFQGEFDILHCIVESGVCPNVKSCVLRKRLKNIEAKIYKEMQMITIASLMTV